MDPRLSALDGATVLITGGAGFIGTRLRDLLTRAGARALVLDNLSAYDKPTLDLLGVDPDDPRLTIGSVADEPLVRHLVGAADYVVHAAAHSTVAGCGHNPHTAFAANIVGTDTVVRAAAAATQLRRLVFLSSAQVYGHGPAAGGDQIQVLGENTPLAPLNVYANTKTWGEFHARYLLDAAGVEYTVLRPFSVYGPGQVPKPGAYSWPVAQFAMYAHIGDPLPLINAGRQVRDRIDVDDAATGIALALITGAAAGQTLNLGTGTGTCVRELAELIRSHFPGTDTVDLPGFAGDPLGGRADTTLMTQVLGWTPPTTLADGVTRYVRWLLSTPAAVPDWLRAEGATRLQRWQPGSSRTR